MKSSDKETGGLVNRNMSPHVLEALGQMADVLDRVVDRGEKVFNWCGPETASKSGALVPPLMLMHHAMEAADAVAVLLRAGAVDPAGTNLRSELEATIYVFYMLEENTEQRGRAYRFAQLLRRSAFLDRLDPKTPAGKEAAERLASDAAMKDFKPNIDAARVAKERAAVERAILEPHYNDVRAKWEAMKKGKYPPAWHELAGGPKSISKLAADADCAGLYDTFYSHFSEESHGGTAMHSVRAFPSGKAVIQPIRYPIQAQLCLSFSVTMLMRLYQRMLERFCPQHLGTLATWYATEILPELQRVRAYEFVQPPLTPPEVGA